MSTQFGYVLIQSLIMPMAVTALNLFDSNSRPLKAALTSAQTTIQQFSHQHNTSFRTITWWLFRDQQPLSIHIMTINWGEKHMSRHLLHESKAQLISWGKNHFKVNKWLSCAEEIKLREPGGSFWTWFRSFRVSIQSALSDCLWAQCQSAMYTEMWFTYRDSKLKPFFNLWSANDFRIGHKTIE